MANIYNKICNICSEINYLEEKIKKGKSQMEKAYFVRKNAFEEFKNYIHYNEINRFLNKQNLNPNLYSIREYIKLLFKDNTLKKTIIPIKVKNSRDLEYYLLYNQRKYYLIHQKLGELIFNEKKEYQVSFKIENNIILLYFSDKDILKCEINGGIIDASSLIPSENIQNNNEIQRNELDGNKKGENKNTPSDLNLKIKNKYKNYLEILIRFFFFSKEMKENKNQLLSILSEGDKAQVFLINKDWFEKFKLFFEYKDLELYIKNNLKKNNINSNDDSDLFQKIISEIPPGIFNNIRQNENIELGKNIDVPLIENKLKIKEKFIDIKLFDESQIINSKIVSLLMNFEYNYNPIKMDIYFIANNKLFLRNSNQIFNGICDEIGFINENNIFIPEYILYYTKIIKINSLNFFFKNQFNNESNHEDKPLEILDENKSPIGYCISLVYIKNTSNESQNDENQNDIKNEILQEDSKSSDENDNENKNNDNKLNNEFMKKFKLNTKSNKIDNINYLSKTMINKDIFKRKNKSKKSKSNQLKKNKDENNQESNQVQNDNDDEFNNSHNDDSNPNEVQNDIKDDRNKKIEKEIKDKIEIILLMHKFENELNEEITESSYNMQNKVKKCVLIKKEWVDNFKNIHLNDEINQYLENSCSDEVITDIELIYFNAIINKNNYYKKIKDAEIKLGLNDFINFSIEDLSQLNKNNDIFYPANFYIINSEIFSKLIRIYQKDDSEELIKGDNYMINYIINNEKIIIPYEYCLINENENGINYYNILICEKNINTNQFDVITIQCFENDKERRNSQFNEYTKIKYFLGVNDNDIDGAIAVKRPLKKEKLDEDIKTLIEIFQSLLSHRMKLLAKLKFSLKDANEREYFIMDSNWMKYFFDFFHYTEFLSLMENNKNKTKNDIIIGIKKSETINKKIKEKNNFDINIKYLNKETKNFGEDGEDNIEFINNFEIIDDTTKNLIEKLLQIKIEAKAKFLFGDNKVFVHFNDEENKDILLLGSLNKKMVFNANILIKFNNTNEINNIDLFLNEIKEKKVTDIIGMFYDLSKNEFIHLKIKNCIAYKIKIDEEIKKIFMKKELVKNKSQNNIMKGQNLLMNKFNKDKDEKINIGIKLNNYNSEENKEENEQGDQDTNIGEEMNNREEEKNVAEESYKLNPFDEKQIKALIKYYIFNNSLKKEIKESSSKNQKFNKQDCYLINYYWMENYKNFYLYNRLVENIKEIFQTKQNVDDKDIDQFIYENLSNDYIKEINDKENEYLSQNFENIFKALFSFKDLEDKNRYPANFQIISSEIFDLIQKRKNAIIDLTKKSFIINSHKIIIEFKSKNIFELLIGKIDFTKYQFIPIIILKYKKKNINIMYSHYHLFETFSIKDFMKSRISGKEIKENNDIVGKLYEIKGEEPNEEKIQNVESSDLSEQMQYSHKIKSNANIRNIKFLFKLHFFMKKLKSEFNNNNSEKVTLKKCYLIKKELIDKYLEFYKFNYVINHDNGKIFENLNKEILVKLATSEKEEVKGLYDLLIVRYPKEYLIKDNSSFNDYLELNKNLFEVDSTQYSDEKFLCYENYIISGEPMEQSQNDIEFKYTIIHDKILLIFNDNINIGILEDKSNVFIPETIIKFDTDDDLKKMFYIMITQGIEKFESDFNLYFVNSNNFIKILKSNNDIKTKEGPKINNFFEKKSIQEKQISKSSIKKALRNKQGSAFDKVQEQKPKPSIKQSLKIILSVLIDSEIIKRKMTESLKGSIEEKYYLLNDEWFKAFVKAYQINEFFDNLVKSKIIEEYIDKEINEKYFVTKLNTSYILEDLYNNLENKVSETKIDISGLYGHKCDFSYVNNGKNEYLIYYKDVILLNSETKNLFSTELSKFIKFKIDSFPVYLGDNKIFIILKETSKNIIEIGQLNNNILEPVMFFEHNHSNGMTQNIKLLISTGFIEYQKYYLLFNEDYISPIFDKNNNKIGQAYRYEKNIKNYSKYISREEYIKAFMEIYFANYKLKAKLNNKKKKEEIYFLVNENFLKNLENYLLVENKINKIDMSNEINEAINYSHDGAGFDKVIECKKIAIIIKQILSKNDSIDNKNNCNESDIPAILPFNSNNTELFYYDNFRLIDQILIKKLEENGIQLFKNIEDNTEC